jgi:hypothetical protein
MAGGNGRFFIPPSVRHRSPDQTGETNRSACLWELLLVDGLVQVQQCPGHFGRERVAWPAGWTGEDQQPPEFALQALPPEFVLHPQVDVEGVHQVGEPGLVGLAEAAVWRRRCLALAWRF